MLNTIKQKLFFYSPLLMCLFIGIILYSIGGDVLAKLILPLLVMYLVMRFYWRRYLKKTGQYFEGGLGLWGVLGTIMVGVLLVYLFVIPEKEEFVTYHPEHPSPERQAINAKLSDYMKVFLDQMLVCGYLTQQGEVAKCEVMSTVELDNNPKTYEVFILTDKVKNCLTSTCKLILGQMTTDEMTKARAHQKEESPTFDGKTINTWQVNNAVIQINPELHSGWHTFELNIDNVLTVFEYDEQTQGYIKR